MLWFYKGIVFPVHLQVQHHPKGQYFSLYFPIYFMSIRLNGKLLISWIITVCISSVTMNGQKAIPDQPDDHYNPLHRELVIFPAVAVLSLLTKSIGRDLFQVVLRTEFFVPITTLLLKYP